MSPLVLAPHNDCAVSNCLHRNETYPLLLFNYTAKKVWRKQFLPFHETGSVMHELSESDETKGFKGTFYRMMSRSACWSILYLYHQSFSPIFTLQFSVPQIEYPLGGSSKNGSHVYFVLQVFRVILLFDINVVLMLPW